MVGLTGLARSGKDTVADILVRDHGFTKMSFAAPLKRMVKNLDPIVGLRSCDCCSDYYEVYLSDLYASGMTDEDIKNSEYGDEARRLWQRFGTDVMRAEDDEYWIDAAYRDMEKLSRPGRELRVVFTDCRFPNEADFIYELSGFGTETSVWQVVRPGVERPEGAHVSEQWTGRLGEEVTIHNDGTLEELAETVGIALNFLSSSDRAGGWVQTATLRHGQLEFQMVEGAK